MAEDTQSEKLVRIDRTATPQAAAIALRESFNAQWWEEFLRTVAAAPAHWKCPECGGQNMAKWAYCCHCGPGERPR